MSEAQETKEGVMPVMYSKLGVYMENLKLREGLRPEGTRRPIPTIPELAREVGISKPAIYNIYNNTVKAIPFDTGARIIRVFRRRGFEMDVDDLIGYSEIPIPSAEEAENNDSAK